MAIPDAEEWLRKLLMGGDAGACKLLIGRETGRLFLQTIDGKPVDLAHVAKAYAAAVLLAKAEEFQGEDEYHGWDVANDLEATARALKAE